MVNSQEENVSSLLLLLKIYQNEHEIINNTLYKIYVARPFDIYL